MLLPGIGSELAAAIRRVNSHFLSLPEDSRPTVDPHRWKRLERSLEAACQRGDIDTARSLVERWEAESMRELEIEVTA